VLVDVDVLTVVTEDVVIVVVSAITPIVLVTAGESLHTPHARGHAWMSSSCCCGVI
jgi:hypothetical protein